MTDKGEKVIDEAIRQEIRNVIYHHWSEMDKRVANNNGLFTDADFKTKVITIGGMIKDLGLLNSEELMEALFLRNVYQSEQLCI